MSRGSQWNERYRRGEHVDDAPLPLVVEAVSRLAPGRALDLACGPGRHAIHLAARGWLVTAVDASPAGLDVLRRRALERGLEIDIHQADLEKHEFSIAPSSYDLICDTFYLQRDLFAEIRRGLRPGGVFCAAIHVEDTVAGTRGRFVLRRGELREAFRDWEILHYAEPAAQAGHRRPSAELVCRRP